MSTKRQANRSDQPWMHFRCPVCERRRPTWAGVAKHSMTVHGTIPFYADAVVDHDREPQQPGRLADSDGRS